MEQSLGNKENLSVVEDEANPSQQRYLKKVSVRSNTSASRINLPYPVDRDKVNFIDWDAREYQITPNDPRWVLPPNFDIGATEWYQNLPQQEQIKVGMGRIAQVITVGAQFEMALNMGIFSMNMDPELQFEDKRYSMHEATEENEHIMMFQELVRRMEPEMKRLGVEIDGGPAWFVAAAPTVTLISRKFPLGFWQVVLTGEEPIDRIQRSLRDYDRDLEKQGIEEGRIHPLVRKIMDVHIEEEAGHIGYANDRLERSLKVTKKDKEAGKDRVGKIQRGLLAAATPLLYKTFADIILVPSKKSQKSMGIPREVAKEVWWGSEEAKKTYHSLFKNALRRADKDGLRNGEVKNTIGSVAWRALGLVEK